jgi:DNA-binding NtrC family response regulator
MFTPSDDTSHRRILVVDDEKNIRLTLSEVLRDIGFQVDTAADGEEALAMLEEDAYWLMLLDLKMPGLGGMDVLRRVRSVQPEIRVLIITAHGTVESAVEAMKLGAVDFLPKPFSPQQIRAVVGKMMEREKLDPEQVDDYEGFIELARHAIAHRQFDEARDHIREALRLDEKQPEAHNLLGILHEIAGELFEAQQRYRKALEIDPTFAPARANLQESVEPNRKTSFFMGEVKKIEKDSSTS